MTVQRTIVHYKLHHLLFWFLVACIWFYLRYQDYVSLQQAGLVTVIKVADLALVIYFSNIVLVPRLLYQKKYAGFVIAFIITVALASFLKMVVMSFITGDVLLPFSNTKEKIYNNFVTQFFLVLASIGIKSVVDYLQLQKQLAEVAKEKAEAELNFLKSQVNPHFLFNSLNAVYFLIDKANAPARDALHKFSDMLRYQLYECNGEKISIEKEVHYLKDYVDLQQLRLNEDCMVQFYCATDVKDFSIQPLLLIPFVENSFKHLSHYNNKKNQVMINLSRSNGTVQFSVYNTTEGKRFTEPQKNGGIGLENVKKRLQLLYPQQHQLHINEKDGWFNVDLQLSIYN